jgi:hypothetical protein
VCVVDPAGRQLALLTLEHNRDGIASLTGRLAKHSDPADIHVGIEGLTAAWSTDCSGPRLEWTQNSSQRHAPCRV